MLLKRVGIDLDAEEPGYAILKLSTLIELENLEEVFDWMNNLSHKKPINSKLIVEENE